MTLQIRLGLHANNPTLLVLSRIGILEERLRGQASVAWIQVAGGARTVDYIAAEIIDVGGTGATPPITAQAKGSQLVYLATSQGRPVGGIAVRADSSIRSVAELRGKRVALGVGSWLQNLLATALDGAGLTWNDIVALDLPEPEARKALLAGGIEAWANGGALKDDGGIRFIQETRGLIDNPSVFFAGRRFAAEQPEILSIVVQSLDEADRWVEAHPREAAQHLVAAAGGPLGVEEWYRHILSRPWGLLVVSDAFLDEQQRSADLFFRFGLLPRKVNVREAVLPTPVAIERRAA
jgi:sulfonate transport system substrate-binding protein